MSNSRWVTIPSCLSGSLRPFSYSFSVCSCHLFLISSASVQYLPFLPFVVSFLAWNILWISPIFLRYQSLSHSIVFLYFFALFIEEGLLISPYCSLELCIHLDISFLLSLAFASLLCSAICKVSSDKPLYLLVFLFLWDGFGHCLL